jgi:hypothetical protein
MGAALFFARLNAEEKPDFGFVGGTVLDPQGRREAAENLPPKRRTYGKALFV